MVEAPASDFFQFLEDFLDSKVQPLSQSLTTNTGVLKGIARQMGGLQGGKRPLRIEVGDGSEETIIEVRRPMTTDNRRRLEFIKSEEIKKKKEGDGKSKKEDDERRKEEAKKIQAEEKAAKDAAKAKQAEEHAKKKEADRFAKQQRDEELKRERIRKEEEQKAKREEDKKQKEAEKARKEAERLKKDDLKKEDSKKEELKKHSVDKRTELPKPRSRPSRPPTGKPTPITSKPTSDTSKPPSESSKPPSKPPSESSRSHSQASQKPVKPAPTLPDIPLPDTEDKLAHFSDDENLLLDKPDELVEAIDPVTAAIAQMEKVPCTQTYPRDQLLNLKPFALSISSKSALKVFGSMDDSEFHIGVPLHSDILFAFRVFFQLQGRTLQPDETEAWAECQSILGQWVDVKFALPAQLSKLFAEQLVFTDENIDKVEETIADKIEKIDPAIYSDSCSILGVLMFPLKEAVQYCGLVPEKADPARSYQRLLHKRK